MGKKFKLLELIYDDDFWVSHNAIMGLSDFARIYGILDKKLARQALLKITRPELIGVISNALSDFDVFLD